MENEDDYQGSLGCSSHSAFATHHNVSFRLEIRIDSSGDYFLVFSIYSAKLFLTADEGFILIFMSIFMVFLGFYSNFRKLKSLNIFICLILIAIWVYISINLIRPNCQR